MVELRVTCASRAKAVAKTIKDLIVKLMEEANGEAEQKGYCDMELATNEQTRKEKTEAVEGLHADIDELEATIQQLTEEISDLTKASHLWELHLLFELGNSIFVQQAHTHMRMAIMEWHLDDP